MDYTTVDETAVAGEDYEAASGTLTFAPGETEKTIEVAVHDDTEIEADETFLVELSNPSNNAWIESGRATGLIENDDSDDYFPDSVNTNGVIEPGDPVSGVLEEPGDQDWFRIQLDADSQYIFELTGEVDNYFRLMDSNGDQVASDDDSGHGNNSRLVFTPDTSETYYAVADSSDSSETGSYSLSVSASAINGPSYVGSDHDTYPYSAVAYIESTFPSGQTYSGSGAVVGQNDVLTASHVIYNAAEGGVADSVDVYPGLDGYDDMPYGSYDADSLNYFEIDQDADGKLSKSESEDDLAMIGFDRAIGDNTGWFGLDEAGSDGYYNLTGYPGDYADSTGPRMTNDFGYVEEDQYSDVFNYQTIESSLGSSGGPLWYSENDSPYVAGVASTSSWAVDIDSHYSTILDWIDGNDDLLSDGTETVQGLVTSGETGEDSTVEIMGGSSFHYEAIEGTV